MRALRKEPEWRYQSAEQLRDDITRYLDGRADFRFCPIRRSARPMRQVATDRNREFAGGAAVEIARSPVTAPIPDLTIWEPGWPTRLITRLSAVRRFAVRPTSSVLRYGADC